MNALRIVGPDEEREHYIEAQKLAIAKLKDRYTREIDLQVEIKAAAGRKITDLRSLVIRLDSRLYQINHGVMPTDPIDENEMPDETPEPNIPDEGASLT